MHFPFQRDKRDRKEEKRFILSIDGGGMRGIVPAYILKRMDEELKKMGTKRPLYSFFDLVCGTSTGGLIALGLTTPPVPGGIPREKGEDCEARESITTGRFFKRTEERSLGIVERLGDPEALLGLYTDNGHRIFIPDDTKGLLRLVGKVAKILGDKYETAPLEEYLDEIYGDTPLSEARVPTATVSYDTIGSRPYVFSSWDSHGYLVKEAARATSAAPTYFAPAHFIDRETGEDVTLLDGGILANNPVLVAYSEARKLYPDASSYHILSLSTACPEYSVYPEEYLTNLDWLSTLIDAYSSGSMEVAESVASLLPATHVTRVWGPYLEKKIKLDDISREASDALLGAAAHIWEDCKDSIMSFMTMMVEDGIHDSVKLKKKDATEALPEL